MIILITSFIVAMMYRKEIEEDVESINSIDYNNTFIGIAFAIEVVTELTILITKLFKRKK